MKSRIVIACAAALSFTSLAVQAETESVRACMESYAAQEFPNRVVSYRVTNDRSMVVPLIASTGSQTVQLTATDAAGRVLGTATCMVKDTGGTGTGSVTIGPIDSN